MAEFTRKRGLSHVESQDIVCHLSRAPNLIEFGIYSAMWCGHCSLNSSRIHHGTPPTEAPWLIQGPG